jgi:hypothetical protein
MKKEYKEFKEYEEEGPGVRIQELGDSRSGICRNRGSLVPEQAVISTGQA